MKMTNIEKLIETFDEVFCDVVDCDECLFKDNCPVSAMESDSVKEWGEREYKGE